MTMRTLFTFDGEMARVASVLTSVAVLLVQYDARTQPV
jgi:hypothetical protein